MNATTLFIRELRFRFGAFLLGLLGVAVMSGCLIGTRSFLTAHDSQTALLVEALESRSIQRMAELRDEARKFSKNLGFNAMLLPAGQQLSELYAEDRSSHFLTEDQVDALAAARLESLNHLRPILRQGIIWSEKSRKIILVGVRGELYIKSPRWQKPIAQAIDPGAAHLGHALARDLGLKPGDSFQLQGTEFAVEYILPETGADDDISVRLDLIAAQRILGVSGKVSGILALTCNCADADPDMVKREVSKIVPDIQVVNFTARAQARKKARKAINLGADAEIEDIRKSRAELRAQAAGFARILVWLVGVGTVLLLSMLTLNSARMRQPEIAMLKALGMGTNGIAWLFLQKALLTGIAGSLIGSVLGGLIARMIAGINAETGNGYIVAVCGGSIIVAVLASLLPAFRAAAKEPADALSRE